MSDLLARLSENLKSDLKDEKHMFRAKSLWAADDVLVEKMEHMLGPFVQDYHSGLKPLFLYEITDTSTLNFFDFVFVRDGAVGLINFFLQHPTPEGLTCRFLIHRDLVAFVPVPWREEILFYDFSMESLQEHGGAKNLYLLAHIDEFNIDVEKTAKQLCNVSKDYQKVYCFFSQSSSWEDGEVERQTSDYFELVRYVVNHFGKGAQFINWHQLKSLSPCHDDFVDLKVGPIYYADSFLDHYFLSRRNFSLDLSRSKIESDNHLNFRLSPYHSVNIMSYQQLLKKENLKDLSNSVCERMTLLAEMGTLSLEHINRRSGANLSEAQLAPSSIKSFAVSVFK